MKTDKAIFLCHETVSGTLRPKRIQRGKSFTPAMGDYFEQDGKRYVIIEIGDRRRREIPFQARLDYLNSRI